MLIEFQDYLTFENIYIWCNFAVLPFWFMLIFIPNSRLTQLFVNSIVFSLLLGATYIYIIYQAILLNESLMDIFKLYQGLDNLYTIFSIESNLLLFWIHFLFLNLFLGSWVSRDSVKFNINRKIIFLPMLLIYFTGPVGLCLYWLVRVFYAKKIGLHD